jgi:hypothetical protein
VIALLRSANAWSMRPSVGNLAARVENAASSGATVTAFSASASASGALAERPLNHLLYCAFELPQ